MNKYLLIILFVMMSNILSIGQENEDLYTLTAGTGIYHYLGTGEGENYFRISYPGIQLELIWSNKPSYKWTIWGLAYYSSANFAGDSEVPVSFLIPYYTEFTWYKTDKKHPFFAFCGYDLTLMEFPNMEKPDYHHNITFGGGISFAVSEKLDLVFKLKPFIVLDNSIGQIFGYNFQVNLQFRVR